MKKTFLLALPLAATLALPAVAQQNDQQKPQDQNSNSTIQTGISNQPSSTQQSGTADQATNDNLGPRQPLTPETHEGFWGHLNPFARKKYVQKQMSPIRNRVNELDELTANNTKMLKDVDARATEGIRKATDAASQADQHAMAANQRATQAQDTAQQATTRLASVQQVVGGIDEYKASGQTELKFRNGQTTLTKAQKEEVDQLVTNAANQRGYIIQVQGFSPGKGQAAIQNSQSMAQAVARYLVVSHQIPVYRIFVVGMGNAPIQTAEGKAQRLRQGRVEVSLLKNGLDQLQANAAQGQSAAFGGATGAAQGSSQEQTGATQQQGVSAPQSGSQSAPWQHSSTQTAQPQGQQPQQQSAQPITPQ